MEKDSLRTNNNGNITNHSRDRTGSDVGLLRSSSDPAKQTPSSSDFVLQWGNRKRLRCMKIQVKDDQSGPVNRTTVRVDRRVVRADKDSTNQTNNNNHVGNGYFNLRQRPASPQPPPTQRVLRWEPVVYGSGETHGEFIMAPSISPLETWNGQLPHHVSHGKCNLIPAPALGQPNSENSSAMRGQSNGGVRGFASPDRGAHDKRGAGSSETAHDSKKGGSSSGSGEAAAPPVWPPKFVIALTNKEKEEDFMAIKGSKLPQRPKKRAKFIQRTLNLVSPGAWLCDLTLERYEVREKKITKKRPRGLKAMGNMVESDSE
ncbi:hypothetical protein COLO4_21025 [Corchorus olitorius]|uniref:Uncharacterized protein n=1 Tax=Corchorus olitorius TaxID=93759 RepID=A0A1R3IVM6_9ROSI|nr:hypothetical protein COLO4_21025 [Corchorus olitorius]